MSGTPIDSLHTINPSLDSQYIRNIPISANPQYDDAIVTPHIQPQQHVQQHVQPQIEHMDNQQNMQYFSNNRKKILDSVPPTFREPLLIIIIYTLLSLNSVKEMFSVYIPQLKQINNGSTNMIIGTVVYGIIFAIIFVLAKKLLL